MFFIHDDILSQKELLWIYHKLINSSSWHLSRTSSNKSLEANSFNSFPGMIIEQNDEIIEEYLSGYFKSIIFRIQRITKKKHSVDLPDKVIRVNLGAKSSLSKTNFHRDHQNEDHWTILGFLNPVWNSNNGGQFFIEDEKIDYLPGRFIVFKSNLEHNGGYVNNENLNYWRITLNIILGN